MGLVTPDFGLLFWMFLTFAIVLFLLKKFAWKPILEMLKEREDSIENALKSAESARDQMAKIQADNDKVLHQAKLEREQMMKEAREVKEKIISDAKHEAAAEADKIVAAARNQIQSEKATALSQIRQEVVALSVEIAEKILRENLKSDSKQTELANKLLKDIQLN
jgi:F-type H+-transporting ATPase subunit b